MGTFVPLWEQNRVTKLLVDTFLVRKPLPDEHRAIQCVRDFEHLEPQVGINWMAGKPVFYCVLRLGARLAVEKGAEPRAQEEYLPVQLDVG